MKSLAWIAVLALAIPADGVLAQQWRPQAKDPQPATTGHYPLRSPTPRLRLNAGPSLAVVPETEPNDTLATANPIAFGDTVTGAIGVANDIDFFSFTVDAGTFIEIDVDAWEVGSPLDPVIGFFGPTGVLLEVNDDFDGLDSRIVTTAADSGMHYAAIVSFDGQGSSSHTYTMRIVPFLTDETEPNDTPATASPLAVGEAATAEIGGGSDKDYFSFTLTGRALLEISVFPIGANFFSPSIELFDTDGVTQIGSNAQTFAFTIRQTVDVAGTYFVAVGDLNAAQSAGGFYRLMVDSLPLGPGDPTTLFASGFLAPSAIAAGTDGSLYVADIGTRTVSRVSAGVVTTLAQGLDVRRMVVDGFGDLLVTAFSDSLGIEGIFRIDLATGGVEIFSSGVFFAAALTLGPDSDVWVHDAGAGSLIRFDPLGGMVDSISANTLGFVSGMAFSPNGQLHMTDGFQTVWRLDGTGFTNVLQLGEFIEGIAFDVDGNLYVANGYLGRIDRYDVDYQPTAFPLARSNLGGPIDIAFLADQTGTMTRRLVASNMGFNLEPPWAGGIVELNAAGISAVGHPIGIPLFVIAPEDPPDATVGARYAVLLTVDPSVGTPTFSIAGGALPAGLGLDAVTGLVSGVPTESGVFDVRIAALAGSLRGFARWELRVIEPSITAQTAIDEILGITGSLSDDQMNFLDIAGNNDGTFNVGDVRAHLRRLGQLNTSIIASMGGRP
ncbi:MAG: putative Ig domain-containing protein [Gemmatimonadales bacterium]